MIEKQLLTLCLKKDFTRMVGDRNASKCVILPIKKLFDKETIDVETN